VDNDQIYNENLGVDILVLNRDKYSKGTKCTETPNIMKQLTPKIPGLLKT
jgi:hypothetical protein